MTPATQPPIRMAIPKGRMQDGVVTLLADAGIRLHLGRRDYRPSVSLPGLEVKILKPPNILEMLHVGSREVGFAGADWAAELDVEVTELLDTGLDPVRLVAAAPTAVLVEGRLPRRALVVASEYQRLTERWIERTGIEARFVRSYGATEVFPPEDADCIVDNTASGSTLRANGLEIVDELMVSSARLYAHPGALEDATRRRPIEQLVTLLRSVLDARERLMLEVNVSSDMLEAVVALLPCMREPTVAPLHGDAGYAVKAAVPRDRLPGVIADLKAHGGTDVVITTPSQIVP